MRRILVFSAIALALGCGSSNSGRESTGSAAGGSSGYGSVGTGNTGNVGPDCQPWDCTNIAIHQAGWTPESGAPMPQPCGMAEDPCTGQIIDCGLCDPSQVCGGGTPNPETSIANDDGVPNVCGGCQTDVDCPSDRICLDSVCREKFQCTTNVHCQANSPTLPICDQNVHYCVECYEDNWDFSGEWCRCVNHICHYD